MFIYSIFWNLLFNAIVFPKLEYGPLVWCPTHEIHVKKVEDIQRKYVKYLWFKMVQSKYVKYLWFKMDNIHLLQGVPQNTLLNQSHQ